MQQEVALSQRSMATWWKQVDPIIERALQEDAGAGDITTATLVPPHLRCRAAFVAKDSGVLAGIHVAGRVFQRLDADISFTAVAADGSRIASGAILARVEGNAASLLSAERVALNFLQRMSGIASQTARYVEAVRGLNCRILDTRKTTPGLRFLEKYAVRMGGGGNHRFNLSDGILIKDNHLAALQTQGMSLKDAVARAREQGPHTLKVEVEVTSLQQALQAMKAGADVILLDNMNVDEMRETVKAVKRRVLIEASGGVRLENVCAIAETGVDLISVGALTHSAPALDISLEFEYERPEPKLKPARPAETSRAPVAPSPPKPSPLPARMVEPELDLHRSTVEDALIKLDRYVYDAYACGLTSVRVIHGKGTGALRQAIRQELPRNPLVKSLKPADRFEGGEGTTIVELADW